MVRRVCRAFGTAKNIVVLNDEAHHCYRAAPPSEAEEATLDADERTEADSATRRRPGLARPASRPSETKLGIRAVYDLSRDAVLPARLRLPRGHALPVGRVATSR